MNTLGEIGLSIITGKEGLWHFAWFHQLPNGLTFEHVDPVGHDSILCCYQHAVLWTQKPECPDAIMRKVFMVTHELGRKH